MSVSVANTGAIEADEIVFVWALWSAADDAAATADGLGWPDRQLVAFQRVTIAAASATTVALDVTPASRAVLKVLGGESTWLAASGATALKLTLLVGGQQPGTPLVNPDSVVGPAVFKIPEATEDVPLVSCG